MPAMEMEWSVKDRSLLQKVKVGDKVEFVVVETGKGEIITELKTLSKFGVLRGEAMKDLAIALDNRPGALADMGDALAAPALASKAAGPSLLNGNGVAHFLFEDGAAARVALEAAGIRVVEEREVLVQRLNQTQPGQLGKITRRMAEAGVNIEVLYSDHDHQLILVVDDLEKGRAVSEAWTREQA